MKKKQLIRGKMVSALTAGMLALTPLLTACQSGQEASAFQETSGIQELSETESSGEEISQAAANPDQKDKEETVYVKASPAGYATEITVETTLKNPGGTEDIEDFTCLTDIKNKEGDEEFTLGADGSLLWSNHGEDIVYEGKSTASLPVTLSVTYMLDGKEIAPEELAGKSGRVTIRFDYENHTFEDVEQNGEKTGVRVPFTAITALFLSGDMASNIEVTNGKAVSMDDSTVIVGLAFPGLEDSLKLGDYELTEEIELPEYVEVSFDTSAFELDFTASIITSGLLEDMETDGLDDADDLIDSMGELTDASKELVDGAAALSDGTDSFRDYFSAYTSGIDAISTGSAQLTSGLKMMKDQKSALVSGAKQLQGSLEEIDGALQAVKLPSQEELDENGLYKAAEALLQEVITLTGDLDSLQAALDTLQDYAAQAQAAAEKAEAVREVLESIDLSAAAAEATATARAQAEKALAESGLTEEEIQGIVGSIDVSGTVSEAEAYIQKALELLGQFPALEVPDAAVDVEGLQTLIDCMEEQLEVLKGYGDQFTGLEDTFAELEKLMQQLQDGASQLAKGSGQLTAGIEAFSDGIDQLYTGSAALSSGASQLADAGGELAKGLDTLAEGMEAMADGLDTFDEEGIQELGKLAGDDLEKVLARVRALKTADASYINFGGIREGQTGSVRFIIETDEIKAEE